MSGPRIILKSRLQDKEQPLNDEQLEVMNLLIAEYAGQIPTSFNNRVLKALEKAGCSPWPHDIPMDTWGAFLEDSAVCCDLRLTASYAYDKDLHNAWLVEWVGYPHAGIKENLYLVARSYLSMQELQEFDLRTGSGVQSFFLLLVAHAAEPDEYYGTAPQSKR